MALALLTGYPGFIGKRLAAKLLADRAELAIAALVEPRMMDAAAEAAAGEERIQLIPGDIAEPRLGMDDAAYDRLASEVSHVFHLAAIYNLAVPLPVATRSTWAAPAMCSTSASRPRAWSGSPTSAPRTWPAPEGGSCTSTSS